jgi:hypothetical protein
MSEEAEKVMVRAVIDQEQAMAAVRSWWHSRLMARDLKRAGEITECKFYYVPYWRIQAKIDGYVDGEVDHGNAEDTDMKRDRITADGSMTWTKIAVDTGDIGISFLKDPDVTTQPFDDNIVPRLEAAVSKNAALEFCEKDIENAIIKKMKVAKVIYKQLRFMPRDVRLVFYPLWTVEYAYQGRMYPVTVDGASGEVVAGKAPGNPLLRKICFAVSFVIALGMIALTAWAYIYNQNACCPGLIIDGIGVCIVIITYGYYHYGAEIRRGAEKNVYWHSDYLEKQDHSLDVKELWVKTISSEKI